MQGLIGLCCTCFVLADEYVEQGANKKVKKEKAAKESGPVGSRRNTTVVSEELSYYRNIQCYNKHIELKEVYISRHNREDLKILIYLLI